MSGLSVVVDRIGMLLSTTVEVDGVWIGVSYSADAGLLEHVSDALNLIKLHDPVRYARIRRDVLKVWITIEPHGIALYVHRRKLVVLNVRYVREAAPEVIASLIVHEATHARLIRFGYDDKVRSRIERCCIRREIAFARRYPGGEPIIQWALERQGFADEFWSDGAREERRREREIEAARELSVPGWFVRSAHRLRGGIAKVRRQAN